MNDSDDNTTKKTILMFPKFIFVAAIILVLIFFAYMFLFKNIKTDTIERQVFIERLLYSRNGLAYYDEEIGRTYLGMIDLKKYDSEHLEKGINYSSNYFLAAKITLQGKESIYYHEELYKKMLPLARAGVKGPGGADYWSKENKVSFTEEGILKTRILRIETIRTRS
ncbi:hypothetical protein ACFLTH_12610 [Bacteroidota bacterium]